jgi:hypothetical protein
MRRLYLTSEFEVDRHGSNVLSNIHAINHRCALSRSGQHSA